MSREVEGRPLVCVLLGLLVGLTAVAHPLNLVFLGALFILRSLRSWTLVGVGLLVGVALSPQPLAPLEKPEYVEGAARIAGTPQRYQDRTLVNARVGESSLRLVLPGNANVHLGEVWRISGVARAPAEQNSAGFAEQGLRGELKAATAERISSGPAMFHLADDWAVGFSRFTHQVLSPTEADWVDSACFRMGNLPREDKEDLELAGSGYLVAASGLHVYVLAGLVFLVLGAVGVPRAIRVICVLLALTLYCLATGIHATTCRAAVGCGLYLSAYLFRREPDSLSSLAFACCGYLLLFPSAVYSMGLQLSAVVCAALALYMPRRQESTFKGYARNGLVAAGVIIAAGQPIVSLYTGQLSAGAVPSNLLAGVAAPAGIGGCFLAYGVWPVSHALGAGLLHLAAALLAYVRVVSHWVATMPVSVGIPAFSGYWLVPYYGLWLVTWRRRAIPA